jgi:sugar phosphate isomerase/epimerase
MILTAKCAPNKKILGDIAKAGIGSVELFTSKAILSDLPSAISVCKEYTFNYVVHAPNDDCSINTVFEFAEAVKAKILVMHSIYFEDEWNEIAELSKRTGINVCVENVSSSLEPLKLMRRLGFGRCMDLEHMQFEVCGYFEEEFLAAMKQASHVHLTGYTFNSKLWHTHMYESPEHNFKVLKGLYDTGYKGMIVSEAKVSHQTFDEFVKLKTFFDECLNTLKHGRIN